MAFAIRGWLFAELGMSRTCEDEYEDDDRELNEIGHGGGTGWRSFVGSRILVTRDSLAGHKIFCVSVCV